MLLSDSLHCPIRSCFAFWVVVLVSLMSLLDLEKFDRSVRSCSLFYGVKVGKMCFLFLSFSPHLDWFDCFEEIQPFCKF